MAGILARGPFRPRAGAMDQRGLAILTGIILLLLQLHLVLPPAGPSGAAARAAELRRLGITFAAIDAAELR